MEEAKLSDYGGSLQCKRISDILRSDVLDKIKARFKDIILIMEVLGRVYGDICVVQTAKALCDLLCDELESIPDKFGFTPEGGKAIDDILSIHKILLPFPTE